MMEQFHHVSVLLNESIDALQIKPDGIYLDGTLGGAGHSEQIARRLTSGLLIGIDRDPTALRAAGERLASYGERVRLVHGNFCDLAEILDGLSIPAVDGMLFDLGVSSPQLDEASRGFSYMADAPLDMRMDRDQSLTAYEIVNNWPREELKSILYEYGEERCAPQIAAAIERVRTDHPIETTLELVDIIRSAMPAQASRPSSTQTSPRHIHFFMAFPFFCQSARNGASKECIVVSIYCHIMHVMSTAVAILFFG